MKKIAVIGTSGAGKTTLTRKLLEQLEKCFIINGDEFSFKVMIELKDALNERFGEKIVKNGKLNTKLFIESPNHAKIFLEEISPIVQEKINKAVEEACKKNQYVIIDWIGLPNMKELWLDCDLRILVKPESQEKRLQHLSERLPNNSTLGRTGEMSKEEMQIRDNLLTDCNSYEHQCNVVIINDYGEGFFEQISKIIGMC